MILRWFQYLFWISVLCGIFAGAAALTQETVTGHAVVTAVTNHGEGLTVVPQETVTVTESGKRREISEWTPLRGPRAGLQLVLLLDDASHSSLSLQFDEIASFIRALPPTTEIAIGYMRNGVADLEVPFTTDHASVIKALRLPIGAAGISGSPYFCLSDMIKRWPDNGRDVRREVIMVTDVVDRYSGRRFDPEDPYVQAAISDAQKAGVIVYSIYYSGAGRFDAEPGSVNAGQNYLTQVSDGTGGRAYMVGLTNPVSLAPFFSDIERRLENQYELSFESTGRRGLKPIRVKTTQPNTKLVAPEQVLVGGVPARQ